MATKTRERGSLAIRLNRALEERSLLKHPFYLEWTAGTLPVERLQEYARQYFHFEAAFPRFLSAIHARTESAEVRQLLLGNLWDEEHGERNHRELWLEFSEALGLSREDVEGSTANVETRALVDHYMRVSRESPVAEALGALYAYEAQVPAVAWEKIKGLREHYGIKPRQLEFFSVHLVGDVAHSDAEVAAIRETSTDDHGVVTATEAAAEKLLGFLDGVYRG